MPARKEKQKTDLDFLLEKAVKKRWKRKQLSDYQKQYPILDQNPFSHESGDERVSNERLTTNPFKKKHFLIQEGDLIIDFKLIEKLYKLKYYPLVNGETEDDVTDEVWKYCFYISNATNRKWFIEDEFGEVLSERQERIIIEPDKKRRAR